MADPRRIGGQREGNAFTPKAFPKQSLTKTLKLQEKPAHNQPYHSYTSAATGTHLQQQPTCSQRPLARAQANAQRAKRNAGLFSNP